MSLPVNFKATSLTVPLVSGVSAGVLTMFTNLNNPIPIFGMSFPPALGIGLIVGVASFITQMNKDTLLPWLGVKDPKTYNAFYIATPFITGLSAILLDMVFNYINGNGIASVESVITMGAIGFAAGILGQYSTSLNSAADGSKEKPY